MNEQIKLEIEKLRSLIEYHNELYHVNDNPTISDAEFDSLLKRLGQLEEEYPEYKLKDSPTEKVGGAHVNTFAPIKHKIQMLSLGKVLNFNEFKEWFYKKIAEGVTDFTAELKMDGLAVSLVYENGSFKYGATRGDGKIGDDITATISAIESIPKKLYAFTEEAHRMEIRGEVYLRKSVLNTINNTRKSQGLQPFANVRNAAAGILRRKEVSDENAALDFGAYLLIDDFEDQLTDYSHTEAMDSLRELNFPIVNSLAEMTIHIENPNDLQQLMKAEKDFERFFTTLEKKREELDYDVDGIVIKANLIKDQKRLGSKTNIPNWAIAYKFPAQEKATKLNDVEWTMGNKGNITPNARIQSVDLMGTTVSNITLHNLEELKRLDIMLDDTILVSRRGDVIPKVERVIKELRTGLEKSIEIPEFCPACGSKTEINGAYLRCSAGDNCSHMDFARIENFVKALEIDGFGPKIIQKLLEQNLLSDPSDIFDLTVDQVSTIERMGKRSATKLINNIQLAKDMPYSKVLMGLTINNVGSSTAEDLIEKYVNLQGFKDLVMIDALEGSSLLEIPGVGDIVAKNILNWVKKDYNMQLLDKLIEKGVGKPEVKVNTSNKLEGKSFCFTGKLLNSRSYYEKLVIENGGTLSSVKKELSYLVAGEDAGSKLNKASKLDVEVIDEEVFMNMI